MPWRGCPPAIVILDGEVDWSRSAAYHVFDVLWLDGRDVMPLPLEERRALLASLPLAAPLDRVELLDDDQPWERACREGWEGVIAKRRDSRYEHRRSPHWLKMKCEATQELVVGGFTDPQGARVGLGALLVGYFEKPATTSCSPARSAPGSTPQLLLDLRARLDRLEIPKPPFTKAKGLPRLRAHWVKPEIVVQVAFIEWTVHGKLRHPRLLGVRIDKVARDVVREAGVITHPEKVLFPDDGITKGELAQYYEAIAPLMLPHMAGRPVTMERYPSGIGDKGLLPEGRVEGIPGVAGARRGPEEGRHRPPSARDRRAVAAVARQPELHHAARLAVARAEPLSPGRLRVRSRSGATTSRRSCARRRSRCATCSTSWSCRAGSRPRARRAFTSSCRSTARPDSARWRVSRTRVGALLVNAIRST